MRLYDKGKLWILYHNYTKEPKNYKSWEFQLSFIPSLQKCLEFTLNWDYYPTLNVSIFGLFAMTIYNSREEDHAGFNFNLKILGLDIDLSYTDIRHWNYNEDRWETQKEVDAENILYNLEKNKTK